MPKQTFVHKLLNPLTINSADDRLLLKTLFDAERVRIKWYKNTQYLIRNSSGEITHSVRLSHDVIPITRDGRMLYRVIAEYAIGSGTFGVVYPIECTLSFSEGNEINYTEQNMLVVKIEQHRFHDNIETKKLEMAEKYDREYSITRRVTHLAMEPPIANESSTNSFDVFLFMRQQPGMELFKLIEYSYPAPCGLVSMSEVPIQFNNLILNPNFKLHYVHVNNDYNALYFVDCRSKSILKLPVIKGTPAQFNATLSDIGKLNTNQRLSRSDLDRLGAMVDHSCPEFFRLSSKIRLMISHAFLKAVKEQVIDQDLWHGDIKLENAMINLGQTDIQNLDQDFVPPCLEVNMIDYSDAHVFGETVDTPAGTRNYFSPEVTAFVESMRAGQKPVFRANPYSDLYSVGVGLKNIWGFFGWGKLNSEHPNYNPMIESTYEYFFDYENSIFTKENLRDIYEVTLQLMDENPTSRLSIEQAIGRFNEIVRDINSPRPMLDSKLHKSVSIASIPTVDEMDELPEWNAAESSLLRPVSRSANFQSRPKSFDSGYTTGCSSVQTTGSNRPASRAFSWGGKNTPAFFEAKNATPTQLASKPSDLELCAATQESRLDSPPNAGLTL